MASPQVSIILPVHNVESYLDKCLQSILLQSFRDFEVIVVDDGSTDRSLEICEGYADRDPRIRIISRVGQGLSATLNAGIRAAQGLYVTSVDPHDRVETEHLAVLYELVTRFHADISVTEHTEEERPTLDFILTEGRITVYDRPSALTALYRGKFLRDRFRGNLYRRSLFDDVEFPPGGSSQDIFTTYRLFARSVIIVRADVVTYHHTRRVIDVTASDSEVCRRFSDRNDALSAKHSFLERHSSLFSDPEDAYVSSALDFCHLKRTFVKTVKTRTEEREEVLRRIDADFKRALSKVSARRIGYLKYLNMLRTLHRY